VRQIFKNQSELTIRLLLDVDITGASVVQIQYRKPGGTIGAWTATVESAIEGIIYYDIQAGDLDEAGVWTFWSYVIFASGEDARGESALVTVYGAKLIEIATTSTSTTTTTTTTTTTSTSTTTTTTSTSTTSTTTTLKK
jgi:hypothetical protein